MRFHVNPTRGIVVGLSALVLSLQPGCGGDDGLGQRYPVSGKVTYQGKPLEQGTIAFLPTGDQGRPATGTISDGEYTVSTMGDRDGALPGDYRVTVISKNVDESKYVIPMYGGQPTPESRKKAAKATKSLIPDKYGRPESSGLSCSVKPESNEVNFDLTN